MSDSLTNDIRQEANTALLEVDKGLYQNNLIGYRYTMCFVKVPDACCSGPHGHSSVTENHKNIFDIAYFFFIFQV